MAEQTLTVYFDTMDQAEGVAISLKSLRVKGVRMERMMNDGENSEMPYASYFDDENPGGVTNYGMFTRSSFTPVYTSAIAMPSMSLSSYDGNVQEKKDVVMTFTIDEQDVDKAIEKINTARGRLQR